jgi:hypothetical protein
MKKSDEIDKLIVDLCRNARDLMEKNDRIAPIAMILSKNKGIIPCMLPFRDDEEKTALYYGLGVGMKKYNANRVILINDAAMKMYNKSMISETGKLMISETEKPLTYPESMRQDGIFIQDINMVTGRVDVYFQRYENKKEVPRFYHELKHINRDAESMGGHMVDQIREGYKTGFAKGIDFIEVNPKTGEPRKPRASQPDSSIQKEPGWKMPRFDGIPGISGLGG